MRKIRFWQEAWDDYQEWANTDIKIYRKIAKLIADIQEQQTSEGLGKPEPLKHDYQGCWSRRITQEHRLVYKVTENEIIIISCKYHY